jgi:hypothetical protein
MIMNYMLTPGHVLVRLFTGVIRHIYRIAI